jgi:hypothetical protein
MKIAAKKHKEGVSHKKKQKNTKKTQKGDISCLAPKDLGGFGVR